MQSSSSLGNTLHSFTDMPSCDLTMSRGPTRQETSISEAQSYANIAAANAYWDHAISEEQILIEDRALDSYHNLLFSLTLFYARFGAWPSHMVIVSHGFKRPRLVDGHCSAMGWPLDRVSFVGIDPPSMAASEMGKEDAIKGVAMAVGDWLDDPHGRGEKLKGKRRKRNPYCVWQGVFEQDSEARGRSQLETMGEGDMETLADNATRPWHSVNQAASSNQIQQRRSQ